MCLDGRTPITMDRPTSEWLLLNMAVMEKRRQKKANTKTLLLLSRLTGRPMTCFSTMALNFRKATPMALLSPFTEAGIGLPNHRPDITSLLYLLREQRDRKSTRLNSS